MFKTTKRVAPKVIKHLTPWYLRWFYSIFGDSIKMATSSIVPETVATSDSVVCFNDIFNKKSQNIKFFKIRLFFYSLAVEIDGR